MLISLTPEVSITVKDILGPLAVSGLLEEKCIDRTLSGRGLLLASPVYRQPLFWASKRRCLPIRPKDYRYKSQGPPGHQHFGSSLRIEADIQFRYVFATFQTSLKNNAKKETASRTIPTFLTLYIFGFLYQLLLAYDALRLKNTIQIIGLCLFNAALLLYAAVQMEQIQDAVVSLLGRDKIDNTVWGDTKPFLIAIPCIIAVGTILLSFIAWKLYDEFAWTIYKHISADLRMKRRYLTFQIYIALLKFDFFLFIGFTIQFVVIVVKRDDIEFWLTIAAIPVTILILIMAGLFTRRESRLGMAAVIVSLQFTKKKLPA